MGLGVVTALMGKKALMACTEAVETVIGEHYDEWVGMGSDRAVCYLANARLSTAKSRSWTR